MKNYGRRSHSYTKGGQRQKNGGILCKGNRLEAYRFLDGHQEEFGVRWLLKRLGICPNAYYNYRKHRKADYYAQKTEVQEQIRDIYYSHNGVDGSRSMAAYLERRGYRYSRTTVHKYMNKGQCADGTVFQPPEKRMHQSV